MNLAFSTFLFFLLLIPGIAARRTYFSKEFGQQYHRDTFFAVFLGTIIPAILIHGIIGIPTSFLLAWIRPEFIVNIRYVLELLSGSPSVDALNSANDSYWMFMAYMLYVSGVGSGFGWMAKQIVRGLKFDLRYQLLRFRNQWHYVFSGEYYGFPEVLLDFNKGDSLDSIHFRLVQAVQVVGGQPFLYEGTLVGYQLTRTGELESITLFAVIKHRLKDNGRYSTENKVRVDGSLFKLRYGDLQNINVSHIHISKDKEGLPTRRVHTGLTLVGDRHGQQAG